MIFEKDNKHPFLKQIVTGNRIIVDVGGGSPFQKNLSVLNFSGLYISIDQSATSKPTLRGDVHFLPLRDSCTERIICKAVLEHVKSPEVVVREIYRVMRRGGLAYFWVPFLYPYHPGKDYGDFFRFTSAGIKLLLKSFSLIKTEPSLEYFATLVDLLPQPLFAFLRPVGNFFDKIIKVNNQNAGWHVLAVK